jgi:hypothetical protein
MDGGEGVDAPEARQNWAERRVGRRRSNGVRRRAQRNDDASQLRLG